MLRAMSRAGYAPNKVTYCALIAALGREGPRGGEGSVQAFELWKELEARNVELDAAAIRTGGGGAEVGWWMPVWLVRNSMGRASLIGNQGGQMGLKARLRPARSPFLTKCLAC